MDKLWVAGVVLVSAAIGAVAINMGLLPVKTAFEPTQEIFYNPLMGYAPPADNRDILTGNSLVYVDITWKELEPGEGQFQWEKIEEDNYMDEWRRMGKHAVLRFVCDIPSDEAHRDIPDWLYEKTGGDGTDYDMSYGKGYSPNYNNETLIACHEKAINALGERYGNDTFISFVELGSLGHWGEWHVKYESGIQRIPVAAVREKYVEPYLSAFPNAKILMRRPFDIAERCGFGLYNDMAGETTGTEEWMSWIREGGVYNQTGESCIKAMPDVWKTAPIGGEFTSSINMEEMLGSRMKETVRLLRESHTTFLGPKIPEVTETGELQSEADEILRNMGYRIRVSKCAVRFRPAGDRADLNLTWCNDGAAPFYWDWPVYLYVMNESGEIEQRVPVALDLRQIQPGTEIRSNTEIVFDEPVKPGMSLGVGIEDPMTGEPAVYLTMNAERKGAVSILYKK